MSQILPMRRSELLDYNTRLSLTYFKGQPDWLQGVDIAWTSHISNSEGAHYHCWIDRRLSKEEAVELLKTFKRCARELGDPISFSYDYIPDLFTGVLYD